MLRLINLSDNIDNYLLLYISRSAKHVCFIMTNLHHRRVNASPLSTLLISTLYKCPITSTIAMSGSVNPCVTANLIVQSQLYKTGTMQSHAHACTAL